MTIIILRNYKRYIIFICMYKIKNLSIYKMSYFFLLFVLHFGLNHLLRLGSYFNTSKTEPLNWTISFYHIKFVCVNSMFVHLNRQTRLMLHLSVKPQHHLMHHSGD
uniref:Uncharacterized protein n=1 Tax=Schizaphis graminum TaxID=13262 RepID=A0A2S2NMV3_SCHGA